MSLKQQQYNEDYCKWFCLELYSIIEFYKLDEFKPQ